MPFAAEASLLVGQDLKLHDIASSINPPKPTIILLMHLELRDPHFFAQSPSSQ